MRALTLPSLEISSCPTPVAGLGQVLVRVAAAALNRADLAQRAGQYPAPPGWPADIPGIEYAGEVVAVGPGTTHFAPGERVMGLVGGGAMAEFVVVDERDAIAIPSGMAATDAAAIPEAFLTAWDAIVHQGQVRGGQRVLVHAIGSGVGTAASQLAAPLGLTLIGTSRSPAKLERCGRLGMTVGVRSDDPEWPDRVGGPVDLIVDTLGAAALAANLSLLAPRGRLVVLGLLTGRVASGLDMGLVLRQRLTIVGTAMRSRGTDERARLIEGFTSDLLPLFVTGALVPVVDAVMPMTAAAAAYQRLASNQTFGKVVLEWR
jgi:putative PIG3 family NAD(P)H quinone oxidoreductase